MAKTVFILGAGASREANAPLMADFLDRARELMATAQDESDIAAFSTVFKAIAELQIVHSKATLDLKNIESVFAAFEMARLFGRLGAMTNVDEIVASMRRLIVRTLERSMNFRVTPQGIHAPEPYAKFARLIRNLRKRKESVAIITFNYDVGLDYGLEMYGIPLTYNIKSVKEDGVPVLKLHGSLNWGICEQCRLVAWPVRHYIDERRRGLVPGDTQLNIGSDIRSYRHCNWQGPDGCRPEPMIVPPTWNKGSHYEQLRLVWYAAAAELAEAEHIFVAGYSWPNTDEFFHHLYALGTAGHALLRHFMLIDPNEELAERYRTRLLGEQARQRFTHALYGTGRLATFSQGIDVIAGVMGVSLA